MAGTPPDDAKRRSLLARVVDRVTGRKISPPVVSKPVTRAAIPPRLLEAPKPPEPSSLDRATETRDDTRKRPAPRYTPSEIRRPQEPLGLKELAAKFAIESQSEEMKKLQAIEARFPPGKSRDQAMEVFEDAKILRDKNQSLQMERIGRAMMLIQGLDKSKVIPPDLGREMNEKLREADDLAKVNAAAIDAAEQRNYDRIPIEVPLLLEPPAPEALRAEAPSPEGSAYGSDWLDAFNDASTAPIRPAPGVPPPDV